ncbi:MAG: 4-alpha-glucanotransferase [Lachnospiraceae bacterium]|nr:4-alpha-glucanotransferase [Lachnospiraceae bacterium]
MRRAGVLLPVYSLPSKYGIGCFSKEAYDFVEMLERMGQTCWQILPLGPITYGDSPYQSPSTFAGNYMYIDLESLIEEGLLTKSECKKLLDKNGVKVDYDLLRSKKPELLYKAYERADIVKDEEFAAFCNNTSWLEEYATYCAFKEYFNDKPWYEWDESECDRIRYELRDRICFHKYVQYLFDKQWKKLKAYANGKGVAIIGDLPIYVAYDSADCWGDKKLFQLDENNRPKAVAGCPPDVFSPTGQLWGNPLYDWDYHKKTGYGWWIRRIDRCREMFDITRIDHFRGFDEYYSIPYGDETAERGHWEKGPGLPFFEMLKQWFGGIDIIAEDLGILTDSVRTLVKNTGFPGMRILHFAFNEEHDSAYLPHLCDKNCIVYTGTHDNNTTVGWFQELDAAMAQYVADYVDGDINDPVDVCHKLVRTALATTADTVIIPLQDYLCLDKNCRTNIPGTVGGNWAWRVTSDQLDAMEENSIKKMTKLYGR